MLSFTELVNGLKPRKQSKTATITYRMTPENKKLLKQIAENDGTTLNGIINSALICYFKSRLEKKE